MDKNEILEKLPNHLLNLVVEQPYDDYTARDHALWRYVMRQNKAYLPAVAHHSYLEGLTKTGISVDKIPKMFGMNRILQELNWAAVAVDGFIPPSAFMEFQAYNVLVIAADIRPINQIEYTAAPDIIHEAAGHAPIISDPDYAEYLRLFGEIGSKAFSSAQDYKLYEAIRHVSILKSDPYSHKSEIEQAIQELSSIENKISEPSEMALIRNLHWWTVEYGLIGELNNPRIYGAGLLSSIGESYSSLKADVKKIPYTIDAYKTGFDITTRQPQLFVTPNFDYLSEVLEAFACKMALRRGGLYGITKAVESENIATSEYSSGIQVTGIFTEVIEKDGLPVYLKVEGPASLNYKNKQLSGHGRNYHSHGFSSPIGKLKNCDKPLEFLNDRELKSMGIHVGKTNELEFASAVRVVGKLEKIHRENGNILIMTFTDCRVMYQGQILFEPSWGVFDMAVGAHLQSVFPGAADPDAYGFTFEPPKEKTPKINYSEKDKNLHFIYKQLRDIRDNIASESILSDLFEELTSEYADDWLACLEITELADESEQYELAQKVRSYLVKFKEGNPKFERVIENGLVILNNSLVL